MFVLYRSCGNGGRLDVKLRCVKGIVVIKERVYPQVVIALGANLGPREKTLERAIQAIETQVGLIQKRSRWYETEPLLHSEQPTFNQERYLNGVILISTDFPPEELLQRLFGIEAELGRKREEKLLPWRPRIVDLDIIAIGDLILQSPTLIVPHPEMHKRDFVLEPMLEVAPDWRHPLLGKSVIELWKGRGVEENKAERKK